MPADAQHSEHLHSWWLPQPKNALVHLSILLIHTTGDPMIPFQMSKRLYKAARLPKELILGKSNVHHNAGSEFKTPEHLARLKRFAVNALSAA